MSEKKKKVPQLRFPGFSGEWEERKLSELVSLFGGNAFSSLDATNDGVRWLKIANVSIGEINWNDESFLPRDFWDKFINYRLSDGDYVMALTRPILNHKLKVAKLKGTNALLNQRVAKLIFEEDAGFVYQLLRKRNVVDCIENAISGTDPPNLGTKTFEEIPVFIPNTEEQKKIGEFLNKLDDDITLHQRKVTHLQARKKGLLQKMFPKDGESFPELRFPGFTDAWEERKLGDLLTETRRPIKMKDDIEYQLVTVKRRNEGVISRGLFKGKDILVKNYFELKHGDYVISKRQVVHGANGIVPEYLDGAIVSNEYLVSVGNKKITTDFLTIISKLPRMYKTFFLSSYGIDIEKLVFNVDDWKKRKIFIPSVPEQKIISTFFLILDNAITLHQRKLNHLQDRKKALLQQMFV